MTRIVVTGVGVVSAAGDTDQTWRSIRAGKSHIQWVDFADHGDSYPISLPGAPIGEDFWPDAMPRPKWFHALPEVIKISQVAAHYSLEQASGRKILRHYANDRVGVFIGTSLGAGELSIQTHRIINEGLNHRLLPRGLNVLPNMVGYHVAAYEKLAGPNVTIAGACSAGLQAMQHACLMITSGEIDAALVGGTDYILRSDFPGAVFTFDKLGLLGRPVTDTKPWTACRPFSENEEFNGFVLGNGAGFLFLESLNAAQKRGAQILAEVGGCASAIDLSSPAVPDPQATVIAQVMQDALGKCLTHPAIDLVIPHGVGTIGDAIEARAIDQIFGEKTLVTSNKPIVGHTMAASGIINALVALMVLNTGEIPPTINISGVTAPINLVHRLQTATVQHVLVNAFGLGGQLATAVFSKFEE